MSDARKKQLIVGGAFAAVCDRDSARRLHVRHLAEAGKRCTPAARSRRHAKQADSCIGCCAPSRAGRRPTTPRICSGSARQCPTRSTARERSSISSPPARQRASRSTACRRRIRCLRLTGSYELVPVIATLHGRYAAADQLPRTRASPRRRTPRRDRGTGPSVRRRLDHARARPGQLDDVEGDRQLRDVRVLEHARTRAGDDHAAGLGQRPLCGRSDQLMARAKDVKAKEKKQKMILGGLGVVLLIVLAIELPGMPSSGGSTSSSTTTDATTATVATPPGGSPVPAANVAPAGAAVASSEVVFSTSVQKLSHLGFFKAKDPFESHGVGATPTAASTSRRQPPLRLPAGSRRDRERRCQGCRRQLPEPSPQARSSARSRAPAPSRAAPARAPAHGRALDPLGGRPLQRPHTDGRARRGRSRRRSPYFRLAGVTPNGIIISVAQGQPCRRLGRPRAGQEPSAHAREHRDRRPLPDRAALRPEGDLRHGRLRLQRDQRARTGHGRRAVCAGSRCRTRPAARARSPRTTSRPDRRTGRQATRRRPARKARQSPRSSRSSRASSRR